MARRRATEAAQESLVAAESTGRARLFRLTAAPDIVRATLDDMRGFMSGAGLGDDTCGTAEIVLAEVLNNVAEHAYGMNGTGRIHVSIRLDGSALTIHVTDNGAAFHGLRLPFGQLPLLDGSAAASARDLPEGGFGWFLIRSLTTDLRYERRGQTNHLVLRLRTTRATPPLPPLDLA